MLVLVDIGNTTVEFALYDKVIISKKFFNSKPLDIEAIRAYCGGTFSKYNKDIKFIIASVVPEVNLKLSYILKEFSNNVIFLSPLHFKNIVKTTYDIKKVGLDILCKSAWVRLVLKEEALILDIGSATVLQYVKGNGQLMGASITLGLANIYKALSGSTSLLPIVSPKETDLVLGNTTIECIENGTFWGYIGCIKQLIQKAQQETDCKRVLITGGLSSLVVNKLDVPFIHNKNLIFEGMLAVYQLVLS